MKKKVTIPQLKEKLRYDPVTGIIYWKVDVGTKIKQGAIAGTLDKNGHRIICINYKRFMAHRIA